MTEEETLDEEKAVDLLNAALELQHRSVLECSIVVSRKQRQVDFLGRALRS